MHHELGLEIYHTTLQMKCMNHMCVAEWAIPVWQKSLEVEEMSGPLENREDRDNVIAHSWSLKEVSNGPWIFVEKWVHFMIWKEMVSWGWVRLKRTVLLRCMTLCRSFQTLWFAFVCNCMVLFYCEKRLLLENFRRFFRGKKNFVWAWTSRLELMKEFLCSCQRTRLVWKAGEFRKLRWCTLAVWKRKIDTNDEQQAGSTCSAICTDVYDQPVYYSCGFIYTNHFSARYRDSCTLPGLNRRQGRWVNWVWIAC